MTQTGRRCDSGPEFWVIFEPQESLLSHFLGYSNSFHVLVQLGARPILNPTCFLHQCRIYPHPLADQIQTAFSDHCSSLFQRFFPLNKNRDWTSLSFWSQVWGSQGVGVDTVRKVLVETGGASRRQFGKLRQQFMPTFHLAWEASSLRTVGERLRGNRNRGNRTESLWEWNLPLREGLWEDLWKTSLKTSENL